MAAYIRVDREKCVGCGMCAGTCAQNAITIENGAAVIDQDACILCRICLDSCPLSALSLVTEEKNENDLSQYSGIWVFAESRGGAPIDVALELTGKARELADIRGTDVTALIFGSDAHNHALELIAGGADRVFGGTDKVFDDLLDLPYAETICHLIGEHKPEAILFGATPFGRSLAPRVAARLGCGLTADCTVLDIDREKGLLLQTRPAFGGNLMATITCPDRRPQMATVRPGIFMRPSPEPSRHGEISEIDFIPHESAVKLISRSAAEARESIADARIIVSAGRGIGSQKNMKLIYELAELLGASVGVSRPLVDLGWADHSHQIGQTGVSVAPDLLITFGISGAVQHLAGIGGAKKIIAVNTDPEAPIFSAAHYKVVADAREVLRELIAKLR